MRLISLFFLLVLSCCNQLEQLSFERRALHHFYDEISVRERMAKIEKLRPENTRDSIIKIVTYSLLEVSQMKDSDYKKSFLSFLRDIESKNLYKSALLDSMNIYNFIFIDIHRMSDRELAVLPYVYRQALNDTSFFTSNIPVQVSLEFPIPDRQE